MLYVSIEFFFVYAKPLYWSCYADRDTHCTPTVVRIVLRPWYARMTAVVQQPLWCNEERFKTYSENRITVIVFSVRRMGIKRSE